MRLPVSMWLNTALIAILALVVAGTCSNIQNDLEKCQGYSLSHLVETATSVQAELDLIDPGCAAFGPDLTHLRLIVEYQTDSRLLVLIQDRAAERYRIPEDILPRPGGSVSKDESLLSFTFKESPFTFQVARKSTGEILFDTTDNSFVFESQFLRFKSWLPPDPNIYGLGEHIDSFRLPNKNYTRGLWARDSDGVPYGENLYGSHPVYFDHRTGGTHGVLFLNSNGIDITLREEQRDGHKRNSIEFIAIGGVLELYFFAGPSPVEVSQQYAALIGTPAMMPYWSLGFHQCKFGYRDWFQVAEVITNYSLAEIPLETMWTDIDYMHLRRVFSLDTERFPIARMRDIVNHLHRHQQHYMVMVDPAIADLDYPAYNRGAEMDVFLKSPVTNGYFRGVVWPGPTVFPDWYHPNATAYWLENFQEGFNPETGIDIDGVWIDMNEPASMCMFPCDDPEGEAERLGIPPNPPPVRQPPRPLPGFHTSEPKENLATMKVPWSLPTGIVIPSMDQDAQQPLQQREELRHSEDNDMNFPPYRIHNGKLLNISDLTLRTDIRHANGLWEYDVHNLYGLMMGMVTRKAMLERRPLLKPFIITRGTFIGAGRYVQKWLGDNASRWDHYRSTIAGMLNFASIFQIPMVGSDVCGFKLVPSDKLCARWATLGAFSPFFRNHAHDEAPPQEFYHWPLVADAARYAISVRYRLLDYLYTALYKQSQDGTPAINPLWYIYPNDTNTYAIDIQYFYGSCILVSPVTEENATDVSIYLPDDVFYEFESGTKVRGRGEFVQLTDVPFDRIPLYIRGGCVLPLRVESANTTTELRKKSFELLVAPGLDGRTAMGSLYVDDGISIDGGLHKIELDFEYNHGRLETREANANTSRGEDEMKSAMLDAGIDIERIIVLE